MRLRTLADKGNGLQERTGRDAQGPLRGCLVCAESAQTAVKVIQTAQGSPRRRRGILATGRDRQRALLPGFYCVLQGGRLAMSWAAIIAEFFAAL